MKLKGTRLSCIIKITFFEYQYKYEYEKMHRKFE